MSEQLPQPSGGAWQTWANRLLQHLRRTRNLLGYKIDDERATEDGLIMWDTTYEWPTVSKNGTWRQIVLADGEANFVRTSNVIAASPNTPYAIIYDTAIGNVGITQGTPASRIVFEEGGRFLLSFSAQIFSSNAATVEFWFWPVINGVTIDGYYAIKATLHNNGATTVVSRSAIFDLNAGDYLEAYWAVSNVSGTIHNSPATAFAPGAPASTLAITRLHG